ncbi:hypothetical protein SAMN05660653_00151 [Desulfonatronum thiosulfatophilum]|uniref:ORC1/DEAH AAA+ ATPase domain-containing protein n=1 Tax=Desulfonatronum thiosulfatophilum TaxID=617002 RepID=A0A1G6A4R5_9BACT|nr:ATP-binding protein [Desulfonatronum thiosulfatophilum]SDB03419.1 hypothetical protein SAMN05660653_00151 [Desulfonatronum thiosulfatophilum]
MRKAFVKTENYGRFVASVRQVEQRGAAEAGLMLVHGLPGLGKSHVADRWAVETGAVYLRAKVDWTPRYFMRDLAHELRTVDPTGTSQQLFTRLSEHLARTQQALVIDEAEFTLAQGAKTLEKIRDLSDFAEVVVVLIGMERIQKMIAKHGQIHSRIAQAVEFTPVTLDDVRFACSVLSEVPIADDLAGEVHRLSNGRMREVLNIISTVERVAIANSMATANLEAFSGMALSFDWQSRKQKVVRAVNGGK